MYSPGRGSKLRRRAEGFSPIWQIWHIPPRFNYEEGGRNFTDRQTAKQKVRQKGRQRAGIADKKTDRLAGTLQIIKTERQKCRQADLKTRRQAGRQADTLQTKRVQKVT
jgi:hypothetical protein